MKFKKKKLLYISIPSIILGVLLLGIGLLLGGRPNYTLTSKGIKTNANRNVEKLPLQSIHEFHSIQFEYLTSICDLNIIEGDDFQMEYAFEDEGSKPSIQITDGVLKISFDKTIKKSINFMTLDFQPPLSYINIYVPNGTVLEHVLIHNQTGDVQMQNLHVKQLSAEIPYGDMYLSNMEIGASTLSSTSGKIDVKQTTIDTLQVNNPYGVFTSNDLVALDLAATSDHGDLLFSNLDTKQLNIVSLYDSTIKVGLVGDEEDYSYKISAEYGDISVNKKNYEKNYTNLLEDENHRSITINGHSSSIVLKTNS